MRRHVFIAKCQLHQIRVLKEQLGENEAVLQEDFSENYLLKQQNEIMSAHWRNDSVSLFTAVLNTQSGSQSYVVVSDELHHDKYAVAAFNRKILGVANQNESIRKLHVFSDGAGSQFKNRYTLSLLLWPQNMHTNLTYMDWSFFGTAHGKGPVDGVGGMVKRAVWRRVLQGQAVVHDAVEFVSVAQEACPGVNILHVPSSDIEVVRQELDKLWAEKEVCAIPQLRAHHFLVASDAPGTLHEAVVSPFSGLQAPHQIIQIVKCEDELALEAPASASQHNVTDIQVEAYYAVDFVTRFYIGRVLSHSDREGFWVVKFLHQSMIDGVASFKWPAKDDIDTVHESVIFYGPVALQGVSPFQVPCLEEIKAAFSQR